MGKIENLRSRFLMKNTSASLLHQIVAIICGFILPRFILRGYGSEVNGLVSSISGFLGVIALLELGMGAVVKSALYKPLAEKNQVEISKIMISAEHFFRKIAILLGIYIIFLIVFYPNVINNSFDYIYTAVLILCIGISNFLQYFFGMANRLLLIADQKGYIQDNLQSVTLIINTIASILLIQLGAPIQMVKLVAALIYVSRPLFLHMYVENKYSLDRKMKYQEEPIKQKWNGIAQHLAAFTISGTDTMVLSVFGSLEDVSIYSVYSLIVKGIMQLIISLTNGISSLMGELWVKKETKAIEKYFEWIEWAFHTVAVFVWGCTLVLIVPFVSVYTTGVKDANYIVPAFAIVITLANFMQTIRIPYNMMVLVAGHYKQTQKYYIIVAILNIVISILMVKELGLIGVAIGTFVALVYNTIWTAVYTSNNFVKKVKKSFLKHVVVDVLNLVLIVALTNGIVLEQLNYVAWFIMAIKVAIIMVILQVIVNMIFYKDTVKVLISKIRL